MQHPSSVILSAVRTPIGKFGGKLSRHTAVQLATVAVKEALERAGVPADLQAHVGLSVHQLRPAAPVAVAHRIPDVDALLAAHNAPRRAPTSPPPPLEFS